MAPIPLSAIRGDDIGAAQRSLPQCGPDAPQLITADVHVHDIGRVRTTKSKATRSRSLRWFWAAERADLVTHISDRKGRPERVIDESHEPPITGLYPTCSVCGVPQVFQRQS